MEGEDHFRKNRESLMERGAAILAARSTLAHEDSVVQELEQGSRLVSCVLPEDSTERRAGGKRWRHTAAIVSCALVLCLSLIAMVAHGTEKRVVTDTRTEDLLLSAAHVQAEHRIVAKHTPISGMVKLAASASAASKEAATPAKPSTKAAIVPKPAPAAPVVASAPAAPTIVVESSAQAAPLKTAPVEKAIVTGPAVATAAPVQPAVHAVKASAFLAKKAPATVAHVAPAAVIAKQPAAAIAKQGRMDTKTPSKAHAVAKPVRARAPPAPPVTGHSPRNIPAKQYEQAPPAYGIHPEPRWAGVAPVGAQVALAPGVAPQGQVAPGQAHPQELRAGVAPQGPQGGGVALAQGYQQAPRSVAFQQQAQVPSEPALGSAGVPY